ncbi:hypothetical protein ACQE3E_17615 [Methylomonas sp. MED-D]|uniref:hypothetical protein n=1 Tax=Methylomonas sp. MED-D TaxID=3418768 RepID=UPI003D000954
MLRAYGDIDGWIYFDKTPHPLAREGIYIKHIDPTKITGNINIVFTQESDKNLYDKRPQTYILEPHYSCSSSDCTINKDEFRRYLEKIEKWPINDSFLKNWFEELDINDPDNNDNEKELKKSIREIWEKEGKPDARLFFPTILKKYCNKKGSAITAVYSAGSEAGIGFTLSNGSTGFRAKKTISNWVTDFKKSLDR